MTTDQQRTAPSLTDLADGTLAGPEWDAWLAAHPEAAAEVAAMQQVHILMQQLRATVADVPADLDARVLAHIHRNTAVRELINLNLAGSGRALLELLNILLSFLPQAPDEQSTTATGNA